MKPRANRLRLAALAAAVLAILAACAHPRIERTPINQYETIWHARFGTNQGVYFRVVRTGIFPRIMR